MSTYPRPSVFFSDLCCLESVHRGAWCDSLTGLLFRGGRASGRRLGQSRAWRLPSGWVVEYRQRDQDAEKSPGTDSYLGFLLCSSVITKLPSDWPDLLTFCLLRQCQKLFARPVCSCPALSLSSLTCSRSALSPNLSPFKHTHPFTQQATNNKSKGKKPEPTPGN